MEYTEQVAEPTDANGNPLSVYRGHGFLSRYDIIGIDARERVILADGEHTQTALLDSSHSITLLEEHDRWGDSVADHVVEFASEFGPWKYVQPEIVEEIERADRDDVSVPESDDVAFTAHAREQWERRGLSDVPIEDAWAESVPVDWPLEEDMIARYHPESTCTFVASPPSVVTTYPPIERLSPRLRQGLYDDLPRDVR